MSDKSKGRKKAKNIVFIIAIVLAAIVLLFAFLVAGSSRQNEGELSMPLGIGCAVVLSGSMEPTISVDDLVFVKKSDSYEPGDIVLYNAQETGMQVLHRIVSVSEDKKTIVTQGDANNSPDQPIDITDIKGRFVLRIPQAGKVVSFVQTPLGLICILGVLVIIFLIPTKKEEEKEE